MRRKCSEKEQKTNTREDVIGVNVSTQTIYPYIFWHHVSVYMYPRCFVWESICCVFSCEPGGKLTPPWTLRHHGTASVWMCLFVSPGAAERNRKYSWEPFQTELTSVLVPLFPLFPPSLPPLLDASTAEAGRSSKGVSVSVSPVTGISHNITLFF